MIRYSVHSARDWSYERLAPYNSVLTAAVNRLSARFGDDVSPEILAENLARGRSDLWLVLDEKQDFAAFLITETEVAISGKKRLLLLELAGRGGADLTDLLPEMEKFARAQGAAEICAYGRLGWKRALARRGYKIAAIKYMKELL